MSGFIDNSKYRNMIKNKPSLSLIPNARPSVFVGYLGINWFAGLAMVSFLGIILYKQTTSMHSAKIYNTRKQFNFEADPYSSKVNCSYKDVPYTQPGF